MADYTITVANVLPSATGSNVRSGVAGEAITQGEPLYVDSADSSLKLAQAVAAKYKAVGIATNSALTGQHVSYTQVDENFVPGGTLAVGDVLCVSATAGGIAPYGDLTSGDYVCVLGVAKSTTVLDLNCSAGLRSDAAIA